MKKIIDEVIKREIAIWILLVAGAFGAVILELIKQSTWSDVWLWFIGILWYGTEGLISAIIYHKFKVSKVDVPETIHTIAEVDGDLYVDGSFTKTVPILTPTEPKEKVPEGPKPIE